MQEMATITCAKGSYLKHNDLFSFKKKNEKKQKLLEEANTYYIKHFSSVLGILACFHAETDLRIIFSLNFFHMKCTLDYMTRNYMVLIIYLKPDPCLTFILCCEIK